MLIILCVCDGLSMRAGVRLPSDHFEAYKYKYATMDKRVAALLLCAQMLKRKCRAAKRLKVMKQQRNKRRREFVWRQAMERFMFVVLMSVAFCNLSPERILWMKERSSHW